tara:strand:+ start:127 stop:798 length:672 start_codon:yes stop_codon:yes gene_type:complete
MVEPEPTGSNNRRRWLMQQIRRRSVYYMPEPPPPAPTQNPIPEFIKTLEYITFNFLRRQPFPREHPERQLMVQMCVQPDCEVEMTCFLLEHGYVELYQEIQDSLNHRLYDLPIPIRNRFEHSYLKFIAEQSNNTFMDDHKTRERGGSAADRIDEIIQKFPLQLATKDIIKDCKKCVICQYDIRKRQHIRKTCKSCIYHRKCADEYLLQARNCAICRRIVITET